jgi:hypothetical protein
MKQDAENNRTRLLPYLVRATPALELLTTTILTRGKETMK